MWRNVENGRLRFSLDIGASARRGLHYSRNTGARSVRANRPESGACAAAEIAEAIDGFTALVTKLTVPVGTNRLVAGIVSQHLRKGAQIAVVSNPKFLREGAAISDFMEPDRIVVGSEDSQALAVMRRIYTPLLSNRTPFVTTSVETAELIKYAANAFLAVKVSLFNEVSDLCEVVGADVSDVVRGIGLDRRIGSSFLQVGPGWGGACFPKDTKALQVTAHDAGVPTLIVEAAIEANMAR